MKQQKKKKKTFLFILYVGQNNEEDLIHLTKWIPFNIYRPSVMTWFAWINWLECQFRPPSRAGEGWTSFAVVWEASVVSIVRYVDCCCYFCCCGCCRYDSICCSWWWDRFSIWAAQLLGWRCSSFASSPVDVVDAVVAVAVDVAERRDGRPPVRRRPLPPP